MKQLSVRQIPYMLIMLIKIVLKFLFSLEFGLDKDWGGHWIA